MATPLNQLLEALPPSLSNEQVTVALRLTCDVEGVAAALGHKPVFQIRPSTLRLSRQPGASFEGEVEFQLADLRLESEGLSASDASKIQSAAHEKVLLTKQYPKAQFRLTKLVPSENNLLVSGTLNLHASSHTVELSLQPEDAQSLSFSAQYVLQPSRWGLKPVVALFGTLRSKDLVVVSIEIKLRA